MSDFLPIDKLEKTVVIPVSIKNGKIEYFYGGNLPEIKDVTAHLVVPAYAIKDKAKLKIFSSEREELILKTGETLLVEVKIEPQLLDKKHLDYLSFVDSTYEHRRHSLGYCIEINLIDDLLIILRGTKKAKLKSCKCFIPFLKDEAHSLNHAYTIISQEFEKQRISHSGNVFKDMYYLKNKNWTSIDVLRQKSESTNENSLISA